SMLLERSKQSSGGASMRVVSTILGIGEKAHLLVLYPVGWTARQPRATSPRGSLAVGAGGPEGVAAGGVDDEVAVFLRGQVGAAVAVGAGGPEGRVVRVVEDEVAVALHDGVPAGLAVGVGGPEGAHAVVVEDEVAVGLHGEGVAAVARVVALAG